MIKNKKIEQKGFAALFVTVMIFFIVFGIIVNIAFLNLSEQTIIRNVNASNQAYFAAESGLEDALVRLVKNMNLSDSYTLNIGNSAILIEIITDAVGSSKIISSRAELKNRTRKVQTIYQITTDQISFHYGVQVGSLGLTMDSNAVVHGNIFSNGPIKGSSNAEIYGDAISAGTGGLIDNIQIKSSEGGGSAWAETLQNCSIDRDAHYTNISNCSIGGAHFTPEEPIQPQDLPITPGQITDWKNQAAAGGIISSYSLGGNSKESLGPVKILGDINISNNAVLTITGTIWVVGNLNLSSNTILQLSPEYGAYSGTIVVDGKISIDSNVLLCGSEGYQAKKCKASVGSYLMLLSTNNSSNPSSPAIFATSNTKTAILYASEGLIKLSSNARLKEATGYGIHMDSNSDVTYETGLADVLFSAGPGGAWKVTSWKEIQ